MNLHPVWYFLLVGGSIDILQTTKDELPKNSVFQFFREASGCCNQCTIIQFALLWARLRGRITRYTGDRFTAKIMYRQYGLVIRDRRIQVTAKAGSTVLNASLSSSKFVCPYTLKVLQNQPGYYTTESCSRPTYWWTEAFYSWSCESIGSWSSLIGHRVLQHQRNF